MPLAAMRCTFVTLFSSVTAVASFEPQWFDQRVDHFSTSDATFRQRYFVNDAHFGGPGSPIFVIIGGEVTLDVGAFYPWVNQVLAPRFGALVVNPEHRYYGESLPFGPEDSFRRDKLPLLTPQQALADTAFFVRSHQHARNCTNRGTANYCPVLSIGGSYPGFLSAMMRLRYPAVVDMAYSASGPARIYSHEVGQYDYYAAVTASFGRTSSGCPPAVRAGLDAFERFAARASQEDLQTRFALCPGSAGTSSGEALADELLFLVEQTFADLNMANYPPGPTTGVAQACDRFMAATSSGDEALLDAVRTTLLTQTQAPASCFSLADQLPAGPNATARCGDWSGCGRGRDGEMWDYQTCTFMVEHLGFGTAGQMFPERPWTPEWHEEHCARRFGVTPQPEALNSLWGFSAPDLIAQSSRILFTNGLEDGWSAGGFLEDLAPEKGIVTINLPNGAHHSDLTHTYPVEGETPDVTAAHARIPELIAGWLVEVQDSIVQITS